MCSVQNCDRTPLARGWCSMHYARWRRNGDPVHVEHVRGDDTARLWSHVDRRGPDECWPWTGYLDHNGRAAWQQGGKKTARPYRYAYELTHGPIPDGLTLDHLCHTQDPSCYGGPSCLHRRCCNPAHLQPVTAELNSTRTRWRSETCVNGHAYTPANTYVNPSSGSRVCRTCRAASYRRYRERRSTA